MCCKWFRPVWDTAHSPAMVNEQDPHDWRSWFTAVHEANAAGAAIWPQVASRAFGMLMSH